MTSGRSSGPARGIERVAYAVLVLACGWFAFSAVWGMFGIPAGGHIGAGSAATTMASEQIVRWKIPYPAWGWYSGVEPPKTLYICHHPFGTFYISAFFVWIFGHHDFVVHLPTVFMSIAIPPLLFGIARERWGVAVGAVAAAAYVVVPIAVGFSNYTNLETICIFGALLFFWGHSRHMTTGRPRHFLASLLGLLFACSGDWAGYLLVAPLLVWCFFRGFLLPPRLTPRFRFQPYAHWWALSVGVVGATLILWLGLFYKAHQVTTWLAQGVIRSGSLEVGIPLEQVLKARKNWIDFSFTPLAIFIGKVAAPVCALRLVLLRRDEEVYALSLLVGATLQYVLFYAAAEIHIFWPHYFAAYYALALAQLVHSGGVLVARFARWVTPAPSAGVAAGAALAVGLLPSVAMAHDAVRSLEIWRETGGKYDDKGRPLRSEMDMLVVIKQVVVPRIVRGTPIDVETSTGWGWEHTWQYQGPNDSKPMPSPSYASAHPFWIARASAMTVEQQKRVAASTHVQVFGDVWLVDQREPWAPIDAYSLNEREPGLLEWLLVDGTEPVRTAGTSPDPWLTWEWRTHFDQTAELPSGEPSNVEQTRIAFNAAVARGDERSAERLHQRIESFLDRSVEANFEEGIRLLGVRVIGGAQPRVESWFEISDPVGDLAFEVRSTMAGRDPLSLIPPPDTDRLMGFPPSLPTKLWRARFIYTTAVVLNHRIGLEAYLGRWEARGASPAPRRLDGRSETPLAMVR